MSRPIRILLGPQRPDINLGEAVSHLPDGPIAVISAGWQEGEADINELQEITQRPMEGLGLYERAIDLFSSDQTVDTAYREKQARLKQQQVLYRLRLSAQAQATRDLLESSGHPSLVAEERRHAIRQLRSLDKHHLEQTEKIHREFEENFNTTTHSEVARHSEEIGSILNRCNGVVITGGNVGLLLNRMRLFSVISLLEDLPIVAWSAGAMVLTNRIMLFHDRMPQGRRDPEIYGAGCKLVPDYVVLPDTNARLATEDKQRMALLARRCSGQACVTLDNGALLKLHGKSVVKSKGVRRVNRSGRLVRVKKT